MPNVVVATAFGGPEVLSVIEVPVADPGPGEVRLEVRAIGVNPVDYKVYSGARSSDPGQLPMRLGFEAAGVVTGVGPDAVGPAGPVSVGDEVIAFRVSGAYADEVTVPATAIVGKPAAQSWEQASGLLLAGCTAVHALTATAVGDGDVLLVHGASGGVGLMLVQLAVGRGATVIGTAGASRHDYLKTLGALPVTYGPGLATRVRELAPTGVDAAIDCIGTDEALDVSLELVADRDRIATIVATGRAGGAGIQVLGGGPGADPGTAIRDAARLELVRLVDAGALTVRVAQTFRLAEAAAAHRSSAEQHSHGKIVLVP